MKQKKKTTQMMDRIRRFLSSRRGKFTYGAVAKALGSGPQGIGQSMKGLGKRGFNNLCNRVGFKPEK